MGFLQIPREIRDAICEILLMDPEKNLHVSAFGLTGRGECPKIFLTCRQIHEEASDVFYKQRNFKIFLDSTPYAKRDDSVPRAIPIPESIVTYRFESMVAIIGRIKELTIVGGIGAWNTSSAVPDLASMLL